MPTTIIIKHGYSNLAIPYSASRVAALADLMENSVAVDLGWSGEMKAVDPANAKEFSFMVVSQDIPVYVAPEETPNTNAESIEEEN